MGLETGTYISDLISSNPASSDGLSQGDDHLRLIKSVIQATFPNINGAVTAAQAQLNIVGAKKLNFADGAAGSPSVYADSENTLGLYRKAAGQVGVTGNLDVSGILSVTGAYSGGTGQLCPVGMVAHFIAIPAGWAELNGATRNRTDALFGVANSAGLIGTAFGVGDGATTYTLPDLTDTNRYLRARGGGLTLGTKQSSQNAAHTHTGTTDSAGAHQHNAYINDPGHSHLIGVSLDGNGGAIVGEGTGSTQAFPSTQSATTGVRVKSSPGGGADDLTASAGAHTHTFTTASSGGSEARPESIALIACIKL